MVCQYHSESANKEAGAKQDDYRCPCLSWLIWKAYVYIRPACVESQSSLPFTELDLMSSSGSALSVLPLQFAFTAVCHIHAYTQHCKQRFYLLHISRLPWVDGRWVSPVRQVSVNHVAASEAPAIISTAISFSIPRIESANLQQKQAMKQEQ